MKNLLFIFVLTSIFVSAKAQNIKGKVVDENNLPIEYANIILLTQKDSAFITGTTTDVQGLFTIEIPAKTFPYIIKATSIGYQILYQSANTDEIGTIILKSDVQILGEVIVKGSLPKTRLKGDALVTNVTGSVLAKAGTAEDVLSKIPGVSNDGGTLNVFGRGTPIIYINGRQIRDVSELDQLSSDNIKSVEVVTNPGARYAASVKAVIRIQTQKAIGEGFGFNNRAYAKHNKKWSYTDQFNFNYRHGGFDLIGMLYYIKNFSWRNYDATQNTYLDKHWKQDMYTKETTKYEQLNGSLGLNYAFNPDHVLGARYQINRQPNMRSSGYFITNVFQDSSPFEESFSNGYGKREYTQHLINFYYNGKVYEWNIAFNADILYGNEIVAGNMQEDITNMEEGDSHVQVTSDTDTENTLYAGKLVLSHPFLGGQFSFGSEYAHTKRTSKFVNLEGILQNDDSKIKEGSTAVFAEYSREFNKINVQAGLRFENVIFDYYESGIHKDEQSKTYNNIFPSIAVSIPLKSARMQVSYTSDITRPNYHMLRNRVVYGNRYTYESGNPLLQPSTAQSIALTTVYKWWRFYADYQHVSDDFIYTGVTYSEDNPTIALLKEVNTKSYNKINISLNASPKIGCWSPQFNIGLRKQWYKADTPTGKLSLNKPMYIAGWQNALELPWEVTLNADVNWNSKSHELNMLYESNWGVNLSLHKEFFNNHLSLLVQGNDIFKTRRNHYLAYFGELRTMSQKVQANMRYVGFTVRYKFNATKSKYKGTGAGETQKGRL